MGWTYSLDDLAGLLGISAPNTTRRFGHVSTDTRTILPGDLFVALSGEHFDGDRFVADAFVKGASGVLCRQPHPEGPCLIVPDPLLALQQFAAWHRRHFDIPLLAITGSCGKTTTKDMVAALLASRFEVTRTEGNLNNEIGCPQSLLRIHEKTEFAVLEMGANHLGEIARLCDLAAPTESAITLIAPAHLEGFGSIENVARAKGEIIAALPPDGCFYVNTDDPWCTALAKGYAGGQVRFGSTGDVVLNSARFDPHGELVLEIAPVGRLRLPLAVRAHATSVLLAVAVGLRHGIDDFEEPLRAACTRSARFRVLRVGPLEVFDDAYNANPASMAAALHALADRNATGARFAALGEMLELGEAAADLHRQTGRVAGECGVTHLYARGPHAAELVQGASEAGVLHAEAIEEHDAIVSRIVEQARPGDVLLVKGSRGMRMETVLEGLRSAYSARENGRDT